MLFSKCQYLHNFSSCLLHTSPAQASSSPFSKQLGGIWRRWWPELGGRDGNGWKETVKGSFCTICDCCDLFYLATPWGEWREFSGEAQAISFEWLLWYMNQWCRVMGIGSQPCIMAPDTQHDAPIFWQMKVLLEGRHFENLSLARWQRLRDVSWTLLHSGASMIWRSPISIHVFLSAFSPSLSPFPVPSSGLLRSRHSYKVKRDTKS